MATARKQSKKRVFAALSCGVLLGCLRCLRVIQGEFLRFPRWSPALYAPRPKRGGVLHQKRHRVSPFVRFCCGFRWHTLIIGQPPDIPAITSSGQSLDLRWGEISPLNKGPHIVAKRVRQAQGGLGRELRCPCAPPRVSAGNRVAMSGVYAIVSAMKSASIF